MNKNGITALMMMKLLLSLSIVDIALVAINIFNAFVLFAHLHPVESPLKKILLVRIKNVVAGVHSTRFGVVFVQLSLFIITAYSATRYYEEDDTSMLIRAIVSGYTFACTSIFVKLSHQMLQLSIDRLMELEKEVARHDICNFTPPTKPCHGCTPNTIQALPFCRIDWVASCPI